jgi:5-methyltetrahydrofolate--homocysteine methyltransferase
MVRTNLKQRLQQGVFILDGGTGTQLMARNVQASKCNDYLGIEAPEIIQAIHADYIKAGSDAVITNSFGASKIGLAKYGLAEQCREINTTAARNARVAAGDDSYVLGDIGPCGDFLEPLGALKVDQLRDSFAEGVRGLLAGGVDGFIVETMTALDEIGVAIEAVRSVAPDKPVFTSMSFDYTPAGLRTMMGVDVSTAVTRLVAQGVDAVGFNCGTASLDEYVELAAAFVAALKTTGRDCLLFAEPNAGKPELVDAQAVYQVSGEEFAQAIEQMHELGIQIFGGCCGTGPEHIRAVASRLKDR